MKEIRICLKHPAAQEPTRAHRDDAGLDLYAAEVRQISEDIVEYNTGVAVEIPEGYFGLVLPRSSVSTRGLLLCNSAGVIDAAYRGSITLRFRRLPNCIGYRVGDRVGQLILIPCVLPAVVLADKLSATPRGEGGYGSTGA